MTTATPTFARQRIVRPYIARADTSPARGCLGAAILAIMTGAAIWALSQPHPTEAVQPAPIVASAPAPAPVVALTPPAADDQPTAFQVRQAENARQLNAELRGGMPMQYATGDIDQDISDLVDSRIDANN